MRDVTGGDDLAWVRSVDEIAARGNERTWFSASRQTLVCILALISCSREIMVCCTRRDTNRMSSSRNNCRVRNDISEIALAGVSCKELYVLL